MQFYWGGHCFSQCYFGTILTADVAVIGVAVIGFPAEKKGQMWGHGVVLKENPLEKINNGTMLSYDIQTTGGQSGSPILRSEGDGAFIVGIHTTGGLVKNSGVKMSAKKTRWVKQCVESNGDVADLSLFSTSVLYLPQRSTMKAMYKK